MRHETLMMMRHRPSNQSSLGSLRCGDACLDSPVNSREARERDVAVGRAFGRAQTGEGAAPAVILRIRIPPNAEGTGSAQYALYLCVLTLYYVAGGALRELLLHAHDTHAAACAQLQGRV